MKTKIRHIFEAALVYFFYGLFHILPTETASNFGGWIGRKLGPKLGASKKALRNIAIAFPEMAEDEHRKIMIGMWDNLGRVIAEYAHLHKIWDHVELVGREHLEAMRDDEKPGITFGAHLANWEIQPISTKKTGLDVTLVYRAPNNNLIEDLLKHARNSGAAGHIPKGQEGARDMVKLMKSGDHLGMLLDQKLNEGVALPFFGRPAMTGIFAAQLALKFDCPLYPAQIERLGGCKFRLTIHPPLKIEKTGDAKHDAEIIMTRINKMMEGWIRQHPEQWLWLHRRWKI